MSRLVLAVLALLAAGAPPARAGLVVPEGSFSSGVHEGGFRAATSIATDDAGRVFVADPAAGHVEVFDSATGGNRFLLALGAGRLVQPVAVAVDNRNRVYVADAARHVVELFDAASRRFAPRGTLGSRGQALGRLDTPAGLATDPTQRLYVTEQGNLRVSVFRPAVGGTIVFQTAFGIGLPEPFTRPGPTARDGDGRLYVASLDEPGGVRAFDRRGRFISAVGGDAPRSPVGVAVDRFDRVVISDTGNGRLLVLGPLAQGAPLLEEVPGLAAPGASTFAPGALLYVLSGGRVLRLRFDDADTDGVADAGDNCIGLPNPDQVDTDGDARGDDCDEDDDGDGRADESDRCPREAAPRGDGDGCRDPASRFSVPVHGRAYRSPPARLTGRAEGGDLGVARVEVALARRLDTLSPLSAAARCAFLDPVGRRTRVRPCARPLWLAARGRGAWRLRLDRALVGPGRYVAMSRARQRGGVLESARSPRRNVRVFSVG